MTVIVGWAWLRFIEIYLRGGPEGCSALQGGAELGTNGIFPTSLVETMPSLEKKGEFGSMTGMCNGTSNQSMTYTQTQWRILGRFQSNLGYDKPTIMNITPTTLTFRWLTDTFIGFGSITLRNAFKPKLGTYRKKRASTSMYRSKSMTTGSCHTNRHVHYCPLDEARTRRCRGDWWDSIYRLLSGPTPTRKRQHLL